MKVELTEKYEETKYPYLGKFPDGEIVMFIGEETGVSLDESRSFGRYSDDWNESVVAIFTVTVTLKND